MRELTIYRPNVPMFEPQKVLAGLEHSARGLAPKRLPILIVTKMTGGAGADTLLSMVAYWLQQWTLPPMIVQVGGVRGPLAASPPAELYQQFETLDPEVMAKAFDAIFNCADRPVLVSVDPNLNLPLLDVLRSIHRGNLGVRILNIHLLPDPKKRPKILDHLRNSGCVVVPAAVTQTWRPSGEKGVMDIPNLGEGFVAQMAREGRSFADAFASASPGTHLTLRGHLERFFADLKVLYGD